MTHASPRAPHWHAWSDGCALPLPPKGSGRMGVGVVVRAPDGAEHTLSREVAGARGDSNDAEAHAIVAALELALSLGARALVVSTDSDVVAAQLTGRRPVTLVPHLAPLIERAASLRAGFDHVEVRLVPRRKNAQADALARGALGLAAKP